MYTHLHLRKCGYIRKATYNIKITCLKQFIQKLQVPNVPINIASGNDYIDLYSPQKQT